MNKHGSKAYWITVGLFIVSITCTGLSFWNRIYSLPSSITWCCDLAFSIKSTEYIFGNYASLFLFLAFVIVALLTVIYKAAKTQKSVNRLLSLVDQKIPTNLSETVADFAQAHDIVILNVSEPIAFCYGFLRPQICFSKGLIELLPANELKATFYHEEYHRRKYDPLRILIVDVISTTLFFLPVIKEWQEKFIIQREIKADKFAIEHTSRSTLASAFHRLITSPTLSMSRNLPSGISVARISTSVARVAELLSENRHNNQISIRSLINSSIIVYLICLLSLI